MKLAKYITTSGLRDILDTLNALLSFILVMFHIVDTYIWSDLDNISSKERSTLNIIEFSILLYFILDFMLNLYISDNKLLFIFKTSSLLEYFSMLPIFFVRINLISGNKYIYTTRSIRFLLVSKFEVALARRGKELVKKIFKLLVTVFSIMILGSSFLLVVEKSALKFHDYLYFVVVTLATVGFGDVYPQTELGRICAITIILTFLAIIPAQVEQLARQFGLSSKFARISMQQSKSKSSELVVILGNPQVDGYKSFLQELYHPDHGGLDIQTVIMNSSSPSDEVSALLKLNKLKNNIQYLEGNPLNANDLKRALVENAKCVIVLADKMAKYPIHEDYKNIMYCLSVKKYYQKIKKQDLRVCVQLLRPEIKDMYYESLNQNDLDQIICVEKLKQNLLSKTCLCPGINTLISFLITSDKPEFDSGKYKIDSNEWIDDYLYGMQNEIYRVPLEPQNYSGYTFSIIASQIYKIFQIILFAIEVQHDGVNNVYVNPSDYIFDDQMHYCYIIATQLPNVEALSKIHMPETITRNNNFITSHKLSQVKQSKINNFSQNYKEQKQKAFYQSKPGQHSLSMV